MPSPPHHHHLHIFEITLLSVPKINYPQEHLFILFQAQAKIKTPAEHETVTYLFLTILTYTHIFAWQNITFTIITRFNRITRISRFTRITRLTRITRFTIITRFTRITRLTRSTTFARLIRIRKFNRIIRFARIMRFTRFA